MLKQSLFQKQLQKLSPQQIKLMKLIQLPTTELEQRIKEEIQENPALEEGDDAEDNADEIDGPDEAELAEADDDDDDQIEINIDEYLQDDEVPEYKTSVNNTSPDDERKTKTVIYAASFQDLQLDQLHGFSFDERQEQIAQQIIGSIDDDGYLRRPLDQIANDLAFSLNVHCEIAELDAILHIIHTFEPAGVGARDLRECLMLQLHRKNHHDPDQALAMRILDQHFNEFSNKQYNKIEHELLIGDKELKAALNEILKLNPKPGGNFVDTQRNSQQIIPDFVITNLEGKLELSLNSRNAPELKISRAYRDMLEHYSKSKDKNKAQKEAVVFVKQKLDAAQWFIDALTERQNTLMNTMTAILNYQYDYFLDGDETKLKPMVLKNIAEITGYDISTISRVSNSKYVQTPNGTISLKFFFSEGVKTYSGEEASSREVKRILQDVISIEDKRHPLTDEELMHILKEKGYKMARRTVAKYRENMNIPVARMRKEI